MGDRGETVEGRVVDPRGKMNSIEPVGQVF
jgi:hypothetical protein